MGLFMRFDTIPASGVRWTDPTGSSNITWMSSTLKGCWLGSDDHNNLLGRKKRAKHDARAQSATERTVSYPIELQEDQPGQRLEGEDSHRLDRSDLEALQSRGRSVLSVGCERTTDDPLLINCWGQECRRICTRIVVTGLKILREAAGQNPHPIK